MNHTIAIETESEYYSFWQGHKHALVIESKDMNQEFKQWDSVTLTHNSMKWKDLPMYKKISFIEDIKGGILLHLKS